MKDFLIMGPEPGDGRGGGFENEAEHEIVLARGGVGSEGKVRGSASFPIRKESEQVPRRVDSRVPVRRHG